MQEIIVEQSEMNSEMLDKCKEYIKKAFAAHKQESMIAASIREDLTKFYNSEHWCCVIGKSYGSSIHHEANYYAYLFFSGFAILIFKI